MLIMVYIFNMDEHNAKVIVITGGSDGLGYQTAKLLCKDNKVIILSPSKDELQSRAKELGCDYQVCDISDSEQVITSVNSIVERYKKIDCLINNAGIMVEGNLQENSYQDIQKAFNVNSVGTVFMTKAVLPYMIRQNCGQIINVISQGGLKARAQRSIYNATKWATNGFMKSLQLEVRKHKIRLVGFYPGRFNSSMIDLQQSSNDVLEVKEVAEGIQYLVNLSNEILVPEFGMIHIDRE